MAAPAMQAIANITLGASTASVAFNNIPQSYRDLRLVTTASSAGGDNIMARFNGDSSSVYARIIAAGTGSAAISGGSNYAELYLSTLGTVTALGELNVFDYSQTDRHKVSLIRGSDSSNFVFMSANRWPNNAAITSITVFCGSAFAVGSTFTLYGVLA